MRLWMLLSALAFVGCATQKSSLDDKNLSARQEMQLDLNFLTSDELQGREAGKIGNHLAGEYLANQLKKNNIKPYFKTYNDTLSNYDDAWNIVGVLPGKDPKLSKEIVILGAHFDHIGIVQAVEGDSIANGANDNASGSVILLDQVRRLSKSNNKRTVMFVFFNAEEKGLLGAKHLAEKLKAHNTEPVLMLNFEMLGVPMKESFISYGTGLELSNVAELINEIAQEELVGELALANEYNLFKRSDNYPFYTEFNIPSHTFCSFDFSNYDYYHHVFDHAELMDVEFMADFSEKMANVINELINLPQGEIKMK
ncbi:M28 family metallopeptidase [Myroides sp. LJL119]